MPHTKLTKPAMGVFIGGLRTIPHWNHDCDTCVWLQSRDEVDLYYCPDGGPTIIARTGAAPEAYASGMTHAFSNPYLALAYNSAKALGLLTQATINEVEGRWILPKESK